MIKITLSACNTPDPDADLIRYNEQLDSTASHQIDAAYKKIKADCDTAQKYRLPFLIDSLMKKDAASHEELP